MGKGNEDLKAKIMKIQNKAKSPEVPAPEPEVDNEEEGSMEELEAEFEAKKKALMKKSSKAPAPEPEDDEQEESNLEKAIVEYSDEGKFRVELIYQLVQLNSSIKEMVNALQGK